MPGQHSNLASGLLPFLMEDFLKGSFIASLINNKCCLGDMVPFMNPAGFRGEILLAGNALAGQQPCYCIGYCGLAGAVSTINNRVANAKLQLQRLNASKVG